MGMALDNGQDVVEVVRHTGGELADGFELLRMAQLRFQAKPFRDVGAVTVNDLACDDRKERPGECATVNQDFDGRPAVALSQAFAGDGGGVRRENCLGGASL